MAIDLSAASGDGLKLILLRVPAKDLIGKCTQVSKRWKRILEDNDFWRKKMEEDGYLWQGKMCENGNTLEWKKFADLPTKLFKLMALKHCFERNFLKDIWNLDERNLTMDPRWKGNQILKMDEEIDDDRRFHARIEIPPKFVDDEPNIPQAFKMPAACLSIPHFFQKCIIIKLADEGLTDEIMDNFRPTIFITEMVANRRNCASQYFMQCSLNSSSDDVDIRNLLLRYDIPEEDQRELRDECRDENGRWVRMTIGKQFKQSEDEDWHRVEHSFKDYPAGMRYLYFHCFTRARGPGPDYINGLKMANCSMMALLEKNAPAPDNEDEEEYPMRKRIKLMDGI